jgi:hypothetical protein
MIIKDSETHTITKPLDIREILSVACRRIHSFVVLFYLTTAHCTAKQEIESYIFVIGSEIVYWL